MLKRPVVSRGRKRKHVDNGGALTGAGLLLAPEERDEEKDGHRKKSNRSVGA